LRHRRSGSTRTSRVRPPRRAELDEVKKERDEAVSAAQQLQEELLTYHYVRAKPRQNELATPKRTVDELEKEPLCGLGQYGANKRQKAASPLPEVDFSDAPCT
jgi:hypothetical protein